LSGAESPDQDLPEVVLVGGTANRDRVVRIGDTVHRPQRVSSPATHALLRHLEAVGFEGAPRFLGVDQQGREVLSYLPGVPIIPPYPDWALTDDALVSVAELLRSYHRAASTFDPSPYAWPPSPPHPFGGDLVSHNDPNLDNIIFRDGRAAALIDFDLAGPGSRVWDVACAARLWVPLRPETYVQDVRRGHALDRFRLFVDAYGLTDADRSRVVDAVERSRAWFWELAESSAAAGHPGFAAYANAETRQRVQDSAAWLSAKDGVLRAALDG